MAISPTLSHVICEQLNAKQYRHQGAYKASGTLGANIFEDLVYSRYIAGGFANTV